MQNHWAHQRYAYRQGFYYLPERQVLSYARRLGKNVPPTSAGSEERQGRPVGVVLAVLSDYHLKAEIGKNAETAFLGQPVAGGRGTPAKTFRLKGIQIALFIGEYPAAADVLHARGAVESIFQIIALENDIRVVIMCPNADRAGYLNHILQ